MYFLGQGKRIPRELSSSLVIRVLWAAGAGWLYSMHSDEGQVGLLSLRGSRDSTILEVGLENPIYGVSCWP